MPVAAPPAPVEQAVLGACDGGADASGPPLLVPAAATQAPLQPAKLAVWRLHAEQVRVGALVRDVPPSESSSQQCPKLAVWRLRIG